MSIYTACKSGIIQRGEELFPLPNTAYDRDWKKIQIMIDVIPMNGERLMSTEEVLMLYD